MLRRMSDADAPPGALIYAGVDEAGYGPRIGPLSVGLSVFQITGGRAAGASSDGDHVPDVWRLLRGVVGKASDVGKPNAPSIFIDDSKRLKGANGLKKRHPLDRLEQAVLATLGALGAAPTTDQELFETLGADQALSPWYVGEPVALPVSTTADHIHLLGGVLGAGFRRKGVTPMALRCELVGETAFNEIIARDGSKSAVNFSAVTTHLRYLWSHYGQSAPIVAIDRQGGRERYGRQLAHAIPDATVRTINETHERSVYQLTQRTGAKRPGRTMTVLFEIKCDSNHLPTALASMIAKLVRELAMARLNRYWCARMPELKPTAGYGVDVNRWLRAVDSVLTPTDRKQLIRLA